MDREYLDIKSYRAFIKNLKKTLCVFNKFVKNKAILLLQNGHFPITKLFCILFLFEKVEVSLIKPKSVLHLMILN